MAADRCILCGCPAARSRLTSTDERITVLVCEACRREVPARHTASDFAPPAATPAAAPEERPRYQAPEKGEW